MIFRSILLAGATALLGVTPALAQTTLTENINNTGIPRNAPALGLSNIYGLNPCSAGTSVGVTTPLFGIGGAVASIDKECETRNNAAVVITGLKDEVLAREILCQVKDIRDAAIRVGKPCLQDQPAPRVASAVPEKPTAKSASVEPPQPMQQRVVEAAITPVSASRQIVASAPPFCYVKNLDLSVYPECTTMQAPVAPQAAVVRRPAPIKATPARTAPQPQPSPSDERAPASSTSDIQTNAAWPQPVSYHPARQSKINTARMIETAVAVAPVPAVSPISDRVTTLLERGSAMVAIGDINAARLLFERAVTAGNSQAAVELGKTFDPLFLSRIKAVGIQADPATADLWYRRATALGDAKGSGLLQATTIK
jgi:hypothetical protein